MNKQLFFRLFFIALLVKGLIFIISLYIHHQVQPKSSITSFFYVHGKDVDDYLIPLENFVDEGVYYRKLADGKVFFAARPPGYAPFYIPLYVFFGANKARAGLTLIMLLFDVLGTILLYKIALFYSKNKKIALIAYVLFLITPFISFYSNHAKTEPVSTALIIGAFWSSILFIERNKLYWFLISGVILTWSIYIRPANGIFLPFLALFPFVFGSNYSIKRFLINSSIFILPFLLVASTLTYRNYKVEGRFIPLLDRDSFGKPEVKALFNFIKTTGGDVQKWIPQSEASWFAPKGSRDFDEDFSNSIPYPNFMFTENFSKDSLLKLRNVLWEGRKIPEKPNEEFIALSNKYSETLSKEMSIAFKVYSEVSIFFRFIFVRHVHGSPFLRSTVPFQIGKIYALFTYYFIIIGALLGGILKFRNPNYLYLSVICAVYMIVHANFLGLIENRYLASIFPFLAILAANFYYQVLIKFSFFRNEELWSRPN